MRKLEYEQSEWHELQRAQAGLRAAGRNALEPATAGRRPLRCELREGPPSRSAGSEAWWSGVVGWLLLAAAFVTASLVGGVAAAQDVSLTEVQLLQEVIRELETGEPSVLAALVGVLAFMAWRDRGYFKRLDRVASAIERTSLAAGVTVPGGRPDGLAPGVGLGPNGSPVP